MLGLLDEGIRQSQENVLNSYTSWKAQTDLAFALPSKLISHFSPLSFWLIDFPISFHFFIFAKEPSFLFSTQRPSLLIPFRPANFCSSFRSKLKPTFLTSSTYYFTKCWRCARNYSRSLRSRVHLDRWQYPFSPGVYILEEASNKDVFLDIPFFVNSLYVAFP